MKSKIATKTVLFPIIGSMIGCKSFVTDMKWREDLNKWWVDIYGPDYPNCGSSYNLYLDFLQNAKNLIDEQDLNKIMNIWLKNDTYLVVKTGKYYDGAAGCGMEYVFKYENGRWEKKRKTPWTV